ncbi:MAG: hypothetical protein HZB15_09810 [Actinobacteria bacterium]|nr:hypothetical protein [Actinomycetota bacterium]
MTTTTKNYDTGLVALADTRVLDARNAFGERRVLHYFVESGEVEGPEGYLVEMPAGNVVNTHFHRVDQFQVFFGAPGATYRRTELGPDTALVHYVDAFTTYGPFRTAHEDMQFYTLRGRTAPFTAYMPEGRAELRPSRRRHHEHVVRLDGPLPEPGQSDTVVLADGTDGPYIAVVSGGPNAVMPIGLRGASEGQYVVLLRGAVSDGGREVDVHAAAWMGPGGRSLELVAGSHGCRVAVLALPEVIDRGEVAMR